jgi:hypothetical protein
MMPGGMGFSPAIPSSASSSARSTAHSPKPWRSIFASQAVIMAGESRPFNGQAE